MKQLVIGTKNMKYYTEAGCVMTQCLIVIVIDLRFEFLMNEIFL
jgi:hypothetical protein